jgi:hypothetical protein
LRSSNLPVGRSARKQQLLLTNQATTSRARLPLARRSAILERMNRRIASVAGLAALAFLLLAASARADEIKLKDGSKIYGTIVGFEDNSFKVKTSYGFAVVQKDQVVSITVTGDAKQLEPDSAKKAEPANAKKSDLDAVKKPEPAVAKASVAAAASPAAKPEKIQHAAATTTTPTRTTQAKASEPESGTSADNSVVEYPHADTATAPVGDSAQPAATATNAAAAPLAKPAAPEPMREEVSGNLYTNDTYGFRMYKPPTWKLIEGARTILPGSITALGTDDQNTYLLIGQAPNGKSLAIDIAATEQRLHSIMDNFRPQGEKQVMISGVSATERHFRGSVDARDWSGIVVYIPHGARVYTIFGMTLADTDLVQIQENVIARAITSLQFTK